MIDRRHFVRAAAGAVAGLGVAGSPRPAVASAQAQTQTIVKPPRLRPGETVGLVNPAGITFDPIALDIVRESMEALGLRVRVGARVLQRHGYFAGRDEERAADLNAMFADPDIRGIVCVRGGWGCARILPMVDYAAIRRQPKVFLGYSDITALHLAIHARTGLVTFHGPVGMSQWNRFNVGWIRRLLFDAEAVTLENERTFDPDDSLVQTEHRTRIITPGTARGRLIGGNLTVLTAMLGSDYVPDWKGRILFLEDVSEAPYRIDRMLTQMRLNGILRQAAAVVFGTCSECDPGPGFASFTLDDIYVDHLRPLGVPAWHGAMIGHVEKQFTVPIGIEAEVDAAKGTIRLLEPAVS
ncbi:MAG: LD-carboxypeptidase [Acidobacteriota bacterium]